MHFSTYLVAVAAATATSTSACTFAFDNTLALAAFGGGGLSCYIYIFDKDDAEPGKDKPDATGDIICDVSGGCADLEYNGETYTFCHSGHKEEVDISEEATLQRKGGELVNIYPDGEDHKDHGADGVSQWASHTYWRNRVGC